MSYLCKWIHEQLERLPLVMCPFNLDELPKNGIYFVYETGVPSSRAWVVGERAAWCTERGDQVEKCPPNQWLAAMEEEVL